MLSLYYHNLIYRQELSVDDEEKLGDEKLGISAEGDDYNMSSKQDLVNNDTTKL